MFSQPVPRMLATVFGWLTDFLTGAIMESRKAARSKAVASPPWMPVIQCNGAHVQIFWSAVNKSSARTIRAQRGASWIYTQEKFLANETDKILPARIFDTFDKFLTVDLRLYFPGEQPKPQFPASKIFSGADYVIGSCFSVEQILWGTDPLGAPEYLLNNVQTAPHDIF